MIIRAVFWFSLVVMLVPVKNDRLNLHSQNVNSLQTLSLIQSVASDLANFCTRNPGSCVAVSALAKNYSNRVQAHAAQLSDVLGVGDAAQAKDKLVTGSVRAGE